MGKGVLEWGKEKVYLLKMEEVGTTQNKSNRVSEAVSV